MQPMRHGQATPNSQARTTRTSQPSTRANSNQALGTDHFGAPISERATDSGLPSRPLQPSAPAIHGSSTPAYIRPNHDPYSHASQSVPEPGARIGGARSALVQRDHESRDSLAGSSRSTTAPNTLTEDRDHGMLTAGGNLHSGAETGTWVDRSHSLPADDGMHLLRRRIHAIRESSASSAEKARQIHTIMTEDYRSTLKVPDSLHPGAHCRATSQSTERPQTPLSSQSKRSSDQFTLTPASTSSSTYSASDGPYYLTMEDLTPTYATDVGTPTQDYNDGDLFSSQGQRVVGPLDGTCERDLGCQHYKRNVKLQCFTCKKWYTCRFCHDDAEEHALIRRKTENMLCMICETPQRAAQWCRNCGTQAACYYCGICKLWDNDASKRIYHCHDCGLCRRGEGLGKDFFHCKTCSVCLPIRIESNHRCIERATQCDCPICGEYMFTSTHTVIFMKCGHSIHQRCFNKYSQTSYRCPICTKTVTNMDAHFRNLDHLIESQPMPPEFKNTKAVINCNDCRAKSVVSYHWLGLKCDVCDSYNTSQIRLFSSNDNQRDGTGSGQDRGISTAAPRELAEPFVETRRSMARPIPVTDSALDIPKTGPGSATGPSSTFSHNYNARSVSPTVGNYFGLSRRRGSIWTTISHPEAVHSEGEPEDQEHSTSWAVSALRRATLGFLGNRESCEEGSGEDDKNSNNEEEEFEDIAEEVEEYEEVDDLMDIFGHR